MGNLSLAIIIGVTTSLVSSITFLTIMATLRPRLLISKALIYDQERNAYAFKVINKSYLFSVIDVKVRGYKMTPVKVEDGTNIQLDEILIKNKFHHILSRKKGKSNATYALIYGIYEDDCNVREALKIKHQAIRIEIFCNHGLSGYSRSFIREFNTESVIKTGSFRYGNSTEIV